MPLVEQVLPMLVNEDIAAVISGICLLVAFGCIGLSVFLLDVFGLRYNYNKNRILEIKHELEEEIQDTQSDVKDVEDQVKELDRIIKSLIQRFPGLEPQYSDLQRTVRGIQVNLTKGIKPDIPQDASS